MIRTIAIDDEPLALQQLATYIKKTSYLELVNTCQSAIEAQKILQSESIDALFVDINMPDLNGIGLCSITDRATPYCLHHSLFRICY